MKKIYRTLTAAFIAILLLSFCTANAQTVNFDDDLHPTKATSIEGLTVAGNTYDVSFELNEAYHMYGSFPGTFTFTTYTTASDAVDAMNAALNAANALKVGQVGGAELGIFYIGYEGSVGPPNNTQYCKWVGGSFPDVTWINIEGDVSLYNADPRNYTIFIPSVGINEELERTPISIYPNPATNVLNIETNLSVQELTILNAVGQVVHTSQVQPGIITIDLSGYTSGLYFVRIDSPEGSTTRKVTIK